MEFAELYDEILHACEQVRCVGNCLMCVWYQCKFACNILFVRR